MLFLKAFTFNSLNGMAYAKENDKFSKYSEHD